MGVFKSWSDICYCKTSIDKRNMRHSCCGLGIIIFVILSVSIGVGASNRR